MVRLSVVSLCAQLFDHVEGLVDGADPEREQFFGKTQPFDGLLGQERLGLGARLQGCQALQHPRTADDDLARRVTQTRRRDR